LREEDGICQKENFVKSATLALLVLAASLSSWSLTNVPGNAVKSSKHYREGGVGNATGRAGSANMTARALLSKDGTTTVEVTTGTFDSTNTPPGSFGKLQFKPLNAAGNALFAQNYFPTTASGYYSFVSPSLHRAEQIQLQGNITDIDRNRTDVVTVVETVKVRPDLAVKNLTFPSSAFVNHPVNISANIVELNGDGAATTTCVLAIDGSNVDQVRNVYVDAAGSVSCAFVYTFSATGGHTIQVTAANVVPGDWDTSNNSSSGTIDITNPISAQHASASFEDDNGGFPSTGSYSFEEWYLGSVIENVSNTYGQSGRTQTSDAEFYSSGCAGSTNAISWQFPVNLTYMETMDGTPVYSFKDPAISGNTSSFVGYNFPMCSGTVASINAQVGSDYANDHWNYLTSLQYYDSAANLVWSDQMVRSQKYTGDVTYFSYGYQCYYWNSPSGTCNSPSDYYTWNSPTQDVYGTVVPVGSTWVPSVATQDAAGNTFSGSISVPLTSSQQTDSQPNSCYNYGPDSRGYSSQSCSSYSNNYTITAGAESN
jgi:hypothetical protein